MQTRKEMGLSQPDALVKNSCTLCFHTFWAILGTYFEEGQGHGITEILQIPVRRENNARQVPVSTLRFPFNILPDTADL